MKAGEIDYVNCEFTDLLACACICFRKFCFLIRHDILKYV